MVKRVQTMLENATIMLIALVGSVAVALSMAIIWFMTAPFKALEAEQYLMEHRWRLQREPKLLKRFTALVARQQVFIFISDARGRPVRQEPSYALLEIMAELA